jgi:hypothetical protein
MAFGRGGAGTLVGLFLVGALLAACGSAKPAATTPTSPSATGAVSTPTSSGSASVKKIETLSAEVQESETATFKAVYTITSAGTTQTVTIEQSPPKSVLSVKSGSVIDTGTATYYCTTSGAVTCLSAGTSNPLSSLAALFSPETALTEFKAAQAEAATKGFDVSFSSGSYAGQSTTCATISGTGPTVKYCVTKQGILAYVMSSGGSFSLTSYSSSPPASDFALPAGASVDTLPAGITLPD